MRRFHDQVEILLHVLEREGRLEAALDHHLALGRQMRRADRGLPQDLKHLIRVQAGLDPNQMLEILGETSVRSPHLAAKGKMMIEGRFEPSFALKYMQKDFDLIMEAAHELRTPLFASAIAHQVYTAANVAGYGDLDYASVVRFLETAAAMHD